MTDSLTQITISSADAAILPLVKRFFHAQGMRSQAARADDVIIARDKQTANRNIVAALRLCPLQDSWLLRSMSVQKEYQRRGIGLTMLQQINDQLSEKACYCFPYPHLESFYARAGFKLIEPEQATEEIKQLFMQYKNNGKDIIIMQFGAE